MSESRFDAITDVAGIAVGHWTDAQAGTGCTVVLCERGAVPGVDVRGGAPGTYETDLLRAGYSAQALHGVLLTGGSIFGLNAAGGVRRWLEERQTGIRFGGQLIPIVSGAVIFDLSFGDASVRPDADAGYAAASRASVGAVEQGSVGAGTGATVAKLMGANRRIKGGIGTASEALADGLIAAAIVVVNAVGDVVDPATGLTAAAPRGATWGEFLDTMASLRSGQRRQVEGNTTIGVVATNARLTKEQANRLATVAHDGLARTIRPVHTSGDGDTIFAMATGEVELGTGRLTALEAFACRAVERAVLNAIRTSKSLGGVPSASEWRGGA